MDYDEEPGDEYYTLREKYKDIHVLHDVCVTAPRVNHTVHAYGMKDTTGMWPRTSILIATEATRVGPRFAPKRVCTVYILYTA